MKKLASLFLISIYLFSAINLKELLKINVLVVHYFETKQTFPQISFFDFLDMHYITDDFNTKDNDRDRQLPFKSGDVTVGSNMFQFCYNQNTSINFNSFIVNESDNFPQNTQIITSNYQALVWRPPQIS